ncbi:hypothetical protein BH24ACT3_BH24ACT3_12000 [soil metagenome]
MPPLTDLGPDDPELEISVRISEVDGRILFNDEFSGVVPLSVRGRSRSTLPRVIHLRRLLLLALLLILAGAIPGAAPASAQGPGERITGYDVAVTVEESGSILVDETIDYDFAGNSRRGIFRDVQVRYSYEPDPDFDRVLRLDVLEVQSATAPDQYTVEDDGDFRRIRIGDPDRTISGPHTYRITYRVEGALNGFEDHDELFWNAIGPKWGVPVEESTVAVTTPSGVTQVACFAGPVGSRLPCAGTSEDEEQTTFDNGRLLPNEAFTVVVGFELGAVATVEPILEERWSIDNAFAVTPATVGVSGGLLAAGVGALALVGWRIGRDQRYVGSATDVAFGNEGGQTETVPLFERGETPVEFVPPDNLRPGEVGTLIDETAHPLDVVATIIDLAARGYLRIEEVEDRGRFAKPDWLLHKLKPAHDLKEFERLLFDGLFEDDPERRMSELKNAFATRLKKVQDALYDETIAQGWFRRRPDHTRTLWTTAGIALLVVGVGLTIAAAATTSLGLVPIPIAVIGLLLAIFGRRFPRRTAKGTGVLRRVLGFKRFIDESEADRARFAERQHLFSEYLPYAIVFGVTEKWAKAVAGLDGELPQPSWYVGHHAFTTLYFVSAMDGFATTTAGTMSSVPASSGSSGFSSGGGFSCGGMGGGGGGSW